MKALEKGSSLHRGSVGEPVGGLIYCGLERRAKEGSRDM
jgi:hypothetical protein